MPEQERIEREVDSFLADRRHLRYIQSEHNQELLLDWLTDHDLALSAASLHEA